MFLDNDGMMYPMHVRRDHKESQYPINSDRQPDIAMVEHAGGIKKHLEEDHRYGRSPQHMHSGHLNAHGQEYLDGMETNPGSDIKIEIGMVYPVETPKGRNGMKHGMLKIDDEIEAQNTDARFLPTPVT